MKKAWIENSVIRDVAHADPFSIYHPDVAVFYDTDVPDDAENGDSWVDGALVKKVVHPAPVYVQPARQWTVNDFRAGMTLLEKTKWDNNSTPEIVTVKQELPKPREGAAELAAFLVGTNVISQASADKILE
jgi:hypothetical protein